MIVGIDVVVSGVILWLGFGSGCVFVNMIGDC